MNDSLLLAVVVGAAVASAIAMRRGSARHDLRALVRLEAKIDALLEHEGIRFDPYADAPPAVLDAVRRGRTIEAIKAYRAAAGVDLAQAKAYVEELQRRAPGMS